MEENNDQQSAESDSQPDAIIPEISLGDAMAGIFTEPSETFSSVKLSLKKNYWLIPLLVLIVVGILSSFLVLRDEELSSQIRDKQKTAMNEQLDKAVKEGKMTREEADKSIEQSQKIMGGSMLVVFGAIGTFFVTLVYFFLKSLAYWGSLKLFKGTATFKDVMNVVGLASIITSIQLVVDTVLAIFTGRLMANIGPVLLVTEESVGSSMMRFIANFDLLNFWYLAILGIGLAKVSGVNAKATIPLVIGLWLVWVLLTSFGPLSMLSAGK
ncbi:MAG: YIP1 family protein [Ignavibacteria bacterium]|nr:YIP1 family protein [Ignavibacteria bacterium]